MTECEHLKSLQYTISRRGPPFDRISPRVIFSARCMTRSFRSQLFQGERRQLLWIANSPLTNFYDLLGNEAKLYLTEGVGAVAVLIEKHSQQTP